MNPLSYNVASIYPFLTFKFDLLNICNTCSLMLFTIKLVLRRLIRYLLKWPQIYLIPIKNKSENKNLCGQYTCFILRTMQSSEIDTERTEKGCIDKATASSEIFNRYHANANIIYVKLSVQYCPFMT
jgi:hypothetical protein